MVRLVFIGEMGGRISSVFIDAIYQENLLVIYVNLSYKSQNFKIYETLKYLTILLKIRPILLCILFESMMSQNLIIIRKYDFFCKYLVSSCTLNEFSIYIALDTLYPEILEKENLHLHSTEYNTFLIF